MRDGQRLGLLAEGRGREIALKGGAGLWLGRRSRGHCTPMAGGGTRTIRDSQPVPVDGAARPVMMPTGRRYPRRRFPPSFFNLRPFSCAEHGRLALHAFSVGSSRRSRRVNGSTLVSAAGRAERAIDNLEPHGTRRARTPSSGARSVVSSKPTSRRLFGVRRRVHVPGRRGAIPSRTAPPYCRSDRKHASSSSNTSTSIGLRITKQPGTAVFSGSISASPVTNTIIVFGQR